MILKILAYRKIAEYYDLAAWLAYLPTGPTCIDEYVLNKEKITDDYDMPIHIVEKQLIALALLVIPGVNIIYLIYCTIWKRYILFKYIIPIYMPDLNEWCMFLYAIIPSLLYYRIWRL